MEELRERAGRAGFPPTLLVHLGTSEEGERFFAERWPEARAVSDPAAELYEALGLARGTLGQLLGPRVLLSGVRAALRGHGVGKPVGDPTRLSGWFLVSADGALHWSHVHEHAGAPRRWEELDEALRAARGTS